jgi:UPF0176 protein
MSSVVNIAAYKFAPLDGLKDLRARLLAFCKARQLRGTILLSTEGINLFVAGARDDVDGLLAELRTLPGLEDLHAKISESDRQPFNRMLVRIKKEIIAFGVPKASTRLTRTSPKLAPRELKQWLDEGLPGDSCYDTRNDYEIKLGTFAAAPNLAGIDHFRQFPHAVAPPPGRNGRLSPIVMFCTGGIRCEKAGPFMQREGLRARLPARRRHPSSYFEECGGAHYDGECFVFDQRVGFDATSPSPSPTSASRVSRRSRKKTSKTRGTRRGWPARIARRRMRIKPPHV